MNDAMKKISFYLIVFLSTLLGCGKALKSKPTFNYVSMIDIKDAMHEIRYRVDYEGDEVLFSDIYVFPRNDKTKTWRIKRDWSAGRYFLYGSDKCNEEMEKALIYVDETGNCQAILSPLNSSVIQSMLAYESVSGIVYEIFEGKKEKEFYDPKVGKKTNSQENP